MILYTFLGYALIGKMVVMKVTMKNPPTVLVAVLIFRPPFELFPYKRPYFSERPFGTNALVIVRPPPNDGVENTYQRMCLNSAVIPDHFLNFVPEGFYRRFGGSDD